MYMCNKSADRVFWPVMIYLNPVSFQEQEKPSNVQFQKGKLNRNTKPCSNNNYE